MPWRESFRPVAMQRVALVAPADGLRAVLVEIADDGAVAFDDDAEVEHATDVATGRTGAPGGPALSRSGPDLERWAAAGRSDLISGENQLRQRGAEAITRGRVAALVGWLPQDRVAGLAERVAPCGGAVVPLPRPPGAEPPTLLARGGAHEFATLVETYGTVPYADLDPSLLAGLAYVVMFGMMFADVGHGALLLLAALAVRRLRWRRLERLRPVWLFLAGAGLASMIFGALYGEFFGPTGVFPVLWLAPLDRPVPLMLAAVGFGAVLLVGAYALGSVNRFREGGWQLAVGAQNGLAGLVLFLGLGVLAWGVYAGTAWLGVLGGLITLVGLAVVFAGLTATAGGGAGGAAQAGVETLNLVTRVGANLVSFARLAAFGLTHAALGSVVWKATSGLAGHGVVGVAGALLVFAVGNAVAFALEGLVAAVQAMRLEYYELFSRIFDTEGRPYRPWHVPLATTEVPCPSG